MRSAAIKDGFSARKVWVAALAATVLFLLLAFRAASADEVRVVDGRGLVRVVKVTKGAVKVVVRVEFKSGDLPKGECVAVNVDGLAAEKRANVSPKGECTFLEVGAGSWQIAVAGDRTWGATVYE